MAEPALTKDSNGSIVDAQGHRVAYFDPKKSLFCPKLSGPPTGPVVGPSIFDKKSNTIFWINIRWSDAERARWEAHKENRPKKEDNRPKKEDDRPKKEGNRNKGLAAVVAEEDDEDEPPYSQEEKNWLKEHYKSEYHFLQMHGLSIYKDEDRSFGRGWMRQLRIEQACMAERAASNAKRATHSRDAEDDESDAEEDESDAEEDESDVSGEEWDAAEHFADYHFDDDELDWLEKHYGNSMHFLLSFGLKYYNDDDCEERRAIVRALMDDDQDDE